MDRTSMSCGLEARVPFADRTLVDYVFNIPWEMKAKDGVVKNILRQSARGLLPDEILFRKKSPYPKTYDPGYEALLTDRLKDALSDPASPLLPLLNQEALRLFLEHPKDYGAPWYGQLMAGPQMIAYLLQLEYFLRNRRFCAVLPRYTWRPGSGSAIVFALEGKAMIGYEGKDYELSAGECFRFEKNGLHSVTANSRFKMALLLILE